MDSLHGMSRGVGGVVAVGLVFEEGEVAGLDDDIAGSVLEVGVVVVFFLPSPSLLLVSFLVVLLDCIGTTEGIGRVLSPFFVVSVVLVVFKQEKKFGFFFS